MQLTVNELGGTVVFDSREDSDRLNAAVVDRYKEGYKEAMRDIWRWLDGPDRTFLLPGTTEIKDFIQSQIKQAEG